MADIHIELQNILRAIYGEEVRGSIYDAIFKINNEVDRVDGEGFISYKTITPEDASSNAFLLSHYVNAGEYFVSYSIEWVDAPMSAESFALLVFDYTDNYVFQIAIGPVGHGEMKYNIYIRTIKKSTLTPYPDGSDWIVLRDDNLGIDKIFSAYGKIEQTEAASGYDRKVSHIIKPGSYTITKTFWDDAPSNAETWGLLVIDYAENYVFQIAIGPVSANSMLYNIYIRTVKKSTLQPHPEGSDWLKLYDMDINADTLPIRRSDETWSQSGIEEEYDGVIQNLIKPGSYLISASVPWQDSPGSGGWALNVHDYMTNYVLQNAFRYTVSYPSSKWRIITKSTRLPFVDWRNTALSQPVAEKYISFYGDSITTYCIAAESDDTIYIAGEGEHMTAGNVRYYPRGNVNSIERTWWWFAADELCATVLCNNSWSGRSVTTVRDGSSLHDKSFSGSAAYLQQQVDKLKTSYAMPDYIVIKLGINDFNHEAPLGDYDGTTPIPEDNETNDAKFSEAYGIMLHRVMETYPLAKVYCCTLNQCERNDPVGFPEKNGNGDLLSDWNDRIRKIARNMGAEIINHDTCGLTYFNLSEYSVDWSAQDQTGLHPNYAGMRRLAYETIKAIGG